VSEHEDRRPTIVLSANSCWNLLNFRGALIGGLEASVYRIAAFAPEDANAEAYRESSQEPTKWQHRRDASRQRIVDNYTFEKMANAYADIWRKVAAEAA